MYVCMCVRERGREDGRRGKESREGKRGTRERSGERAKETGEGKTAQEKGFRLRPLNLKLKKGQPGAQRDTQGGREERGREGRKGRKEGPTCNGCLAASPNHSRNDAWELDARWRAEQ